MEQIIKISEFVIKSFLHIWPYLLVTIPLAVLVNLSGTSGYITKVFRRNTLLSVFLATIAGAFSPFCSCGVIPVISSLLIGGVPLAPVMSFWIASPSMDPEIFFLSSSVIGWKLAVWRLSATFIISLFSGYITHLVTIKGFIGNEILKSQGWQKNQVTKGSFGNSVRSIFKGKQVSLQIYPVNTAVNCAAANNLCCSIIESYPEKDTVYSVHPVSESCNCSESLKKRESTDLKKILNEIMKATLMVTKFMGIAFLIQGLIHFYLPNDVISRMVHGNPSVQVILATLIGIPMYTSNITALPMVGGLLELGLNKGAALSFLIAGATTTLPAMVAVWGITRKKVFCLYLAFVLIGALVTGICFNIFG